MPGMVRTSRVVKPTTRIVAFLMAVSAQAFIGKAQVLMVGAGASRAEIHDYAGRLMRALGFPMLVLPTHWDNYFLPFVEAFTQEVHAASARTRVILPKYFQPIALEPAKR